MSDPMADRCVYCGSPNVLDDAAYCGALICMKADEACCRAEQEYEHRQLLSTRKAICDLWSEGAPVWGTGVAAIMRANQNLSKAIGLLVPHQEAWIWRENRKNRQEMQRVTDMPLTTGTL